MPDTKHLPNLDAPRRRPGSNGTLLVFSQVYLPDPASVGQHVADVAAEMVRRGWRVIVYASSRGHDDPNRKYLLRENIDGVDVRRLPFSQFGKKSLLSRGLGMATFMTQVVFRGLFAPQVDGILFSTSPPLVGVAATAVRMFRGVPLAYWAMDLNPDQLLALEKFKPHDPMIRFLESVNRMILRNSDYIVTLDRFMAGRLFQRGKYERRTRIIPPWPHETFVEPVAHDDNPFRVKHDLGGKFVVMYSGNHSPSNPLDTLLAAAEHFREDPQIRFLFIGGGVGKKAVEQQVAARKLTNCLCLPYQPLAELRYSLSAADVHVVSLGEKMVGIIHPCKIYGAMVVGRPVLFFGPSPSHVSDLLDEQCFGQRVAHGDVPSAIAAIERLRTAEESERKRMGNRAQEMLQRRLGQEKLNAEFCDGLEQMILKKRRGRLVFNEV